jgi:hypothetical protein
LHAAAVQRDHAGAEIVRRREVDQAGIDRCAAGVGVRAAQRQRARAGLDQRGAGARAKRLDSNFLKTPI